MSGSFLEKILAPVVGLLRRKERFFVVEVMANGVRATPFVLDADERELKIFPALAPKKNEPLAAFARRLSGRKNAGMMLAIDGGVATTVQGAVALPHPGAALDDAALENVIAQAMWKLFDRERARAATKMNVPASEVTIADARIVNIALDGRDAIAPVGYRAAQVEVRLSLTMMPREAAEVFAEAFSRNVFSMSEASVSWARLLWTAAPQGHRMLCAGLLSDGVAIATADADGARYHDAFQWGEDELISGVANALAVTSDIARYVVRAVREERGTSPLFAKKVHGIIGAELQLLVNGLGEALSRTEASAVRVLASYDIPRMLFAATLKNAARRTVKILPVMAEDIGKHFGFTLQWKMSEGRAAMPNGRQAYTPAIVSFFDAYIAPARDSENAIARQRVRWLLKNGEGTHTYG